MAQKILDGLMSKNQYQYVREYPGQGGKIYFNTYQVYNRSVDQSGNIDQGTVETFQLVLKGNTWYKGARLGEDGKWYALTEKESGIYIAPSDVTKPGTFKAVPNATDNLILGQPVIEDLNAGGRTSLRYQAINNAKFQLKKAGGLSEDQVNREFDISNNIAPPGSPGTPSLLGPAVKPDDKTKLTSSEDPTPDPSSTTPEVTFEDINGNFDIRSRTLKDDEVNAASTKYPFLMKDMDVVIFKRKEYSPRAFSTETLGFGDRSKERNITGSVALGIQPSLRDTNTVSWAGQTLNLLETAAADFFFSASTGGGSGVNDFLDRAVETYGKEGGNLKTGALTALANQAVGTTGLLSRLEGAIFNPNLELLFQGPELRTFNFNFNLSPRDRDEAKSVKRIIKFFKKGMAVQRTQAELFLKAPHTFDIEYLFEGKNLHTSLNKIKECALTSCSVDYTPSNSYMTFDDGTPVQYTLSLTFQELEPVYADEYDEDNHSIGY